MRRGLNLNRVAVSSSVDDGSDEPEMRSRSRDFAATGDVFRHPYLTHSC